MPAGPSPTSRATLVVPRWMSGAEPPAHLTYAALRARPAPGADRRWFVQTEESYLHLRPGLVSVEHLAGPASPTPRLGRLRDAQQTALIDDAPGRAMMAEAVELQRRAERSGNLVDGIVAWQAATMNAPVDQLAAVAGEVRETLLALRMTENPREPVTDHAGVHLVRRAPALVHRTKLCLLLLQHDRDPRLAAAGDPATLQATLQPALDAGETVMAASQDLYSGILLGEVYLAPLLGALSPAVWAFCAPRALGIVVYSLGQPLLGDAGNAAELLQTLPRQGAEPRPAEERRRIPTLSAGAPAAALHWWSSRLDALFGVLTDPALATDERGVYVPSRQAHTLLSAEQLFRRVTSIQAAHRDGHARRVLLFTVLDTLERLTGRKIDVFASARYARRRLAALAADIPPDAAQILLPGAHRAVAALEELQRGFFIARQLGRTTVDLPDKRGGRARPVDLDRAAATYLKVLRDATHGHGGKGDRVPLTNALLAQHDGRLPHDLALLGYLYLLDLLHRTDDLARWISGRSGLP